MTREECIQQQVIAQFPTIKGKIRIQRERRIWVEAPLEIFIPLFQYVKEELKFAAFCTLTGLDEGEDLGFVYNLAQQGTGIVFNLKVTAPKSNPLIPTITNLFPSAELPEREVEDLLGAKVSGLAPGLRYPLPDNWPPSEYPLRKDWKPSSEDAKTEEHNG